MLFSHNRVVNNRIGAILLLLMAMRLLPFGYLHYHSGTSPELQNKLFPRALHPDGAHTIANNTACAFEQYLNLINQAFFLTPAQPTLPVLAYPDNPIPAPVNPADPPAVNILNKGSPV